VANAYDDLHNVCTGLHISFGIQAGAVVVCEKQAANYTSNMTSGSTRLDVQFIDQLTNYPTSWSWDFGDSGTASIENPVRDMQIREPYSYLTQLIQWSDTRT